MIKSKLVIVSLIGFVTILISCNIWTNSNATGNKAKIVDNKEHGEVDIFTTTTYQSTAAENTVASKALEFVENLEAGKRLSLFFNNSWTFVYQEDNRCDGTTDGQIDKLKSTQIDTIITLQVKNKGDGWACDKKESTIFDLDFDLKKKIENWDRFEVQYYDNQEEDIVFVVGAGESDYLKLQYDDNKLIVKLQYGSEDPG